MFYLSFIYLILLVFLGKKYSKNTRFILASIPFVVIAFIRFGIGADYFSYEYIYSYISTHNLSEMFSYSPNIQVLFKFIMFVFTRLRIPYHIFVALLSSSIILVTLRWIFNNSEDFELSVLLQYSILYIYWSLSALRQGIVLAGMLYVYFNGKKEFSVKEKVIATILLALIHPTALIVPVIYIVSRMKWNRNLLIVLLLVSPLFKYVIGDQLINIVSKLPVLGKVSRYVSYGEISFFSAPSLMRLSFIFIILIYYNKLIEKDSSKKTMIDFALLGLIGYFYLPVAMVVGTRTTIFSYALVVIIFPMIVSLFNERKLKMIGTLGLILISIVSFANELVKLKDRTGFIGPVSALNYETVFNGSRTHFEDNPNLFYFDVLKKQYNSVNNKPLSSRVESVFEIPEAFYESHNDHISVKFSNGLYGVLNSEGKVVVAPKYKNRVKIYNEYFKFDAFEGFGIHKNYRLLPKSAGDIEITETNSFNYYEISDELQDSFEKEDKYIMSGYKVQKYDLKKLNELDFLKSYDLTAIEVATEFTFDIEPSFSYVRLLTKSKEYYIILKNGLPHNELLYNRVEVYDHNGFAIGYTEYAKSYINRDGEVVWYEALSE